MIDVKQTSDWNTNYSRHNPHCYDHCIVCGRPVRDPKYYVRLFWGTTAVMDSEAAEIIAREGSGGDLLYYPVGSDCYKHHQYLKPYVEDAAIANQRICDEMGMDNGSDALAVKHGRYSKPETVTIEVELVSAGCGKPSQMKESDIEFEEGLEFANRLAEKLEEYIDENGEVKIHE